MRILPLLIRTVFVPVCLLLGCLRTVAYLALMHKLPGLAFSRSEEQEDGGGRKRWDAAPAGGCHDAWAGRARRLGRGIPRTRPRGSVGHRGHRRINCASDSQKWLSMVGLLSPGRLPAPPRPP